MEKTTPSFSSSIQPSRFRGLNIFTAPLPADCLLYREGKRGSCPPTLHYFQLGGPVPVPTGPTGPILSFSLQSLNKRAVMFSSVICCPQEFLFFFWVSSKKIKRELFKVFFLPIDAGSSKLRVEVQPSTSLQVYFLVTRERVVLWLCNVSPREGGLLVAREREGPQNELRVSTPPPRLWNVQWLSKFKNNPKKLFICIKCIECRERRMRSGIWGQGRNMVW